jgi:hypothetical protein
MNQPAYGTPSDPGRAAGEWSVEERLRQQAVRNLRRRAAFRIHLLVYCLVNLLVVVTWLSVAVATGVWFPWFVFCTLGWGIGLAVHAWVTYRGDELSEERIRAEMSRIMDR